MDMAELFMTVRSNLQTQLPISAFYAGNAIDFAGSVFITLQAPCGGRDGREKKEVTLFAQYRDQSAKNAASRLLRLPGAGRDM